MARINFSLLSDDQSVVRQFALPADFPTTYRSTDPNRWYAVMDIPKRNSRHPDAVRRVYLATDRILRLLQKQIATSVASSIEPHDCVHGFVRRRSIVTNAARHVGAKLVLRLDIRNFFGSICAERVSLAFQGLGAGKEAADLLAITTTLDGRLIEGTSSSPALANLVCSELDVDLQKIASKTGCSYSRYADDLSFSGDQVPEIEPIEAILRNHGFDIATHKTRLQRRGRFQFVTGLSVADPTRPRAPRRMKRWLRSTVNAVGKYGIHEVLGALYDSWALRAEINRIDGSIAYLYCVEPEVARRLDRIWQPALRQIGREQGLRRESLYAEKVAKSD